MMPAQTIVQRKPPLWNQGVILAVIKLKVSELVVGAWPLLLR